MKKRMEELERSNAHLTEAIGIWTVDKQMAGKLLKEPLNTIANAHTAST